MLPGALGRCQQAIRGWVASRPAGYAGKVAAVGGAKQHNAGDGATNLFALLREPDLGDSFHVVFSSRKVIKLHVIKEKTFNFYMSVAGNRRFESRVAASWLAALISA